MSSFLRKHSLAQSMCGMCHAHLESFNPLLHFSLTLGSYYPVLSFVPLALSVNSELEGGLSLSCERVSERLATGLFIWSIILEEVLDQLNLFI